MELFFYSNPIFINRTILFQWKILLELFEFCAFILFLDIFFNLRNVVIYTCECEWEFWGFFFYGQLKWKDIDRLFSSLCFYFICLSCCVLYIWLAIFEQNIHCIKFDIFLGRLNFQNSAFQSYEYFLPYFHHF